jgi:ATP-binding cassette, subfamily F, member 3
MVTHNEMFLHALAERLVIFEEDGISVFEGGYQSFLDRVGWKDERDRVPRTGKVESAGRQNQKEIRRRRSELISAKSKAMKPIEIRMKELERLAEKRDIDMQALNKELIVASNRQDGHAVVELSKSLHQAKKDVDDMLDELEHLSNELEKLKTAHDLNIKEFDEALAPDGTYGK